MLSWGCTGRLIVNGNMEGQCTLNEDVLLDFGHVRKFLSWSKRRCLCSVMLLIPLKL